MKGKVLVVDDDPTIRSLIKTILEQHHFKVIEASNWEEALSAASTLGPNIILLDVMLPEKDGYQVCRELKQSSITRHIPLIFVTVKDQISDRIEGFRLGADDYIIKPFSPLELAARVEAVLNRAFHLLDSLTGLPGRGVLEDEILKALEGGFPFSLMIFQLAEGEKLVETCGYQSASEVIVFLANVLIKILSRDGEHADFLGIYDRYSQALLVFGSKPDEIFNEILEIWKKLQPMEEKRLKAPGLLQLNAVHLRIENTKNQTLETLLKKVQSLFEEGKNSGSFVSHATL
jgi:PleD family two-component response regulator